MARQILNLFFTASFLTCLLACDDSSSSTSPEVPGSSETVETISSSSVENSDIPLSSETIETEEPSSSANSDAIALTPDADGFYTIQDVYKNLKPTDKVAFVLRHAERIDDLGQEATLTENGELQAIQVGENLAFGDTKFHYASSGFVRTTETCKKIALGRGEGDVEVLAWEGLDGNWFVLDTALFNKYSKLRGGAWKVTAKWAYTGSTPDAFYDLKTRGEQYISEVIVPDMAYWDNRVGILVSHDMLLMPLTVYATNGAIDFKFHENGRWVNYLTGVAVILSESGEVSLLPVKALDTGIMGAKKEST